MTSQKDGDFFDTVEVGQEIPPLVKKATVKELFMTWGKKGGELHPVFGDSHLEDADTKAASQAQAANMDTIHFNRILPGTHALEFLSQMITNWLPSPKGWLFGGQMTARLLRPILPDETVKCRGRITQKVSDQETKRLVCDIWIEKETGEQAVVGEATIRF